EMRGERIHRLGADVLARNQHMLVKSHEASSFFRMRQADGRRVAARRRFAKAPDHPAYPSGPSRPHPVKAGGYSESSSREQHRPTGKNKGRPDWRAAFGLRLGAQGLEPDRPGGRARPNAHPSMRGEPQRLSAPLGPWSTIHHKM